MSTDREQIRSLDDPEILVQTPATIYDAIPPLTPRTEREAEFYQLGDCLLYTSDAADDNRLV